MLLLSLFILQEVAPTLIGTVEKWTTHIVFALVTGLIAWFFGRKQANANVSKTEGEIIGNWQDKYFGLQEKLGEFKIRAEAVENELDIAKRDLKRCLSGKGDCRELIKKITPILSKIEEVLKEFAEFTPLVNDIRETRADIEELNQAD